MNARRSRLFVSLFVLLLAGGTAPAASHFGDDPNALRAALIAAVETQDSARLDGLTRDFHATIVQHFGQRAARARSKRRG